MIGGAAARLRRLHHRPRRLHRIHRVRAAAGAAIADTAARGRISKRGLRMKAIDKFEGRPGEDAAHWVNQFKRAVKGQSDEVKYFEFKKALSGQAKDWMKRQIDSDTRKHKQASSNRWCKRLKCEYKVEDHHLERMEFGYKQKFGQDAREYVQKKLDLIGKAYGDFTEGRKLRRLLEGVNKHYYNQMAGSITMMLQLAKVKGCDVTKIFTDTLAEQMVLYDNANDHEVFTVREDGSRGKEPPNGGAAAQRAAARPEAVSSELAQRMTTVMANTFPAGDPFPQNNFYDGSRTRRAGPGECFGCYATDHMWSECPTNVNRGNQSSGRQNGRRGSWPQRQPPQFQRPPPQYQQPPPFQYSQQPPQYPQPQYQQPQPYGGFQQQPQAFGGFQQQPAASYQQPPQARLPLAIQPGSNSGPLPHPGNGRPS